MDTGTEKTKPKDNTTINYKFENYDIAVKLNSDGRFLAIEEVKINKDFRSFTNRTPQKIFSKVDELPSDDVPSEEQASE